MSVSVWWDFENCGVPVGANVSKLAHNISTAVRNNGIKGSIQIAAYGDMLQLSRANQEALYATGINLTHIPRGGKNTADRSIIIDLMYWVSQNPPPAHIFLISGDGDFANILHRLRMHNYNILLASTKAHPPFLCGAATIMWQWEDLVRGQDLVGKHLNQPPDGPYGSWYGNYKAPIEDPSSLIGQPMCSPKAESADSGSDSRISKEVLEKISMILESYPNGIHIGQFRSELENAWNLNQSPDIEDPSSLSGQHMCSPKVESVDYSGSDSQIPKEVLEKISTVLESYPDGIRIGQFRLELENAHVSLGKNFYGYKKFARFLLSMPHILSLEDLGNDRVMVRGVTVTRDSGNSDVTASSPFDSDIFASQRFDQNVETGEVSVVDEVKPEKASREEELSLEEVKVVGKTEEVSVVGEVIPEKTSPEEEPSLKVKVGIVDEPGIPQIPKEVLEKISMILESYPDGIHIEQFRPELENAHVSLGKNFYGYKKFTRFLLSMPHIVSLEDLGNDRIMVRGVTGTRDNGDGNVTTSTPFDSDIFVSQSFDQNVETGEASVMDEVKPEKTSREEELSLEEVKFVEKMGDVGIVGEVKPEKTSPEEQVNGDCDVTSSSSFDSDIFVSQLFDQNVKMGEASVVDEVKPEKTSPEEQVKVLGIVNEPGIPQIPKEVLEKISMILESYPDGLFIGQLRTELENAQVSLGNKFYGYKKFSRFLLSMPHIVSIEDLGNNRIMVRGITRTRDSGDGVVTALSPFDSDIFVDQLYDQNVETGEVSVMDEVKPEKTSRAEELSLEEVKVVGKTGEVSVVAEVKPEKTSPKEEPSLEDVKAVGIVDEPGIPQIPKEVLEKISMILELHPDGIHIGQFLSELENAHVSLGKNFYGHKKFYRFLLSMPHILSLEVTGMVRGVTGTRDNGDGDVTASSPSDLNIFVSQHFDQNVETGEASVVDEVKPEKTSPEEEPSLEEVIVVEIVDEPGMPQIPKGEVSAVDELKPEKTSPEEVNVVGIVDEPGIPRIPKGEVSVVDEVKPEKTSPEEQVKVLGIVDEPGIPQIPNEVLEKISMILESHPNGLPIQQLREELENAHVRRGKNYFGYKKFSRFLLTMPHILNLEDLGSGYIMVRGVTHRGRDNRDFVFATSSPFEAANLYTEIESL